MIKIICNYINLTNGIEAIPSIGLDNCRFIRIQSTLCEQHLWDRIIQDLDYDFLMNLALGNKCIVYDFGAKKPKSRAMYQGLEFIKYVLSRRWLNKEYITNVSKKNNSKQCCNKYFDECYKKLESRSKKKIDYFIPYINCDLINLFCVSDSTTHDGDKTFYNNLLVSERSVS